MNELNKMGFDPMIPLGEAAPRMEPRIEVSKLDPLLLPPMPKPVLPVEPRIAMTPAPAVETVKPMASKSADAPMIEPAKAPMPGRMAWLPEMGRMMITPTRSKGVIAAGLASLGLGIGVAQWLMPKSPIEPVAAQKPETIATPTLQSPPAAPAKQETVAATTSVIELPNVVLPLVNTVPVTTPPVNSATPVVTPMTLDSAVKPAGGIELPTLPSPGGAAPTAVPPTVSTAVPPMAPLSGASPSAPGATPPTAPVIPTMTPPTLPPITLPDAAKIEPGKIEPGKTEPGKIELPRADASTAPTHKTPAKPEVGGLPVLPTIEVKPIVTETPKPTAPALPKVEIAPPAIVEVKPQTPVLPSKTAEPVKPAPSAPSLPTMPAAPAAAPAVLPSIEMPEPRPLTAKPTPSPSTTVVATANAQQDYDVDVHYATNADTYASISRKHLGDDRYAEALRAYNGNRAMTPNQPVDIPPLFVLRKQYANLINAPRPVVMPAAAEATPAARSGGLKTYEVPAGGLTFREIARKSHGDESLWGPVWELNSKLRADEPVPAGTRIKLPADSRIGE
jgi:hypothetical protein